MYSVPPGASAGNHWVAVQNEHGRSGRVAFQVSAAVSPLATPRVDRITLVESEFLADNTVRVTLYVQGANIDVGAEVLVDGVSHSSNAHKVILNDLLGADPAVLAFPIRHYLSRVVPLQPRPIGSEIRVQVVNEAGERSAERSYRLPQDAATLDSDGDGIPDVVETVGTFDNGRGHGPVDIRALGTNPFRADVLVEVDVMEGVSYPPENEVFERARQMFAAAPIINPFGPNGINLAVDASGRVEAWDYVDMWLAAHNRTSKTASFAVLKQQNFTPARRGLFHYAVWAKEDVNGYSGYSNIDFEGTRVGDGFYVSFDTFPASYQTTTSKAETFVHELGHNLGQRHGGDTHLQFTPNYWSVMSYSWQLRTGRTDAIRLQRPTCTQIFYGSAGASEPNGALPTSLGTRLDYSEGMGPTLVGNTGSLDEKIGVCGQPIDWNGNGQLGETGVNAGFPWCKGSGCNAWGPASDYANWANLNFLGPVLGGSPPSGGAGGPPSAGESAGAHASSEHAKLVQTDGKIPPSRRLEGQPTVETRRPVVSTDAGTRASDEAVKLKRIEELLKGIEASRQLPAGTVTVGRIIDNSVTLQHDLPKLKDARSQRIMAPFSIGVTTDGTASVSESPAQLEYRASRDGEDAHEVVGLKSRDEIAAKAFRSGDAPVSLSINIAGLTARQVEGPSGDIPVLVTVGGSSRQLRSGEMARFGDLEVRIVRSSNLSDRNHREGPPYVLRLEAQSIR